MVSVWKKPSNVDFTPILKMFVLHTNLELTSSLNRLEHTFWFEMQLMTTIPLTAQSLEQKLNIYILRDKHDIKFTFYRWTWKHDVSAETWYLVDVAFNLPGVHN